MTTRTTHEYDGCALSFGGGVNSVALVVLLASEGWRGPILYAETGTEWPETDAYVAMFEREWLAPRGLSITRLGGEWHTPSYRYSVIEYCERHQFTPMKRARFCTVEWKVLPIERWCKANDLDPADNLIGIAADEARRMTDKVRPLVDRHLDRNACARIIVDAGLPLPGKSACWMCLFQSGAEWQHLYRTHPDLYERAAALERLASTKRGKPVLLMAANKVSLDEFAAAIEAQASWLDFAEYHVPCLCRI